MINRLYSLLSFGRNNRLFFIAFLWCLSISTGYIMAFVSKGEVVRLFFAIGNGSSSVIGLFFATIFPFLLSAVVVSLGALNCIFLLLFVKGVAVGLFSAGLLFSFSSAGWIVCLLLSFSEMFGLVPMLWFWISSFMQDSKASVRRTFLRCMCVLLALVFVDIVFISPLALSLF